MNLNRQRLLDRFLRYVQIDTTANDATDEYPSSAGQRELGEILVSELRAMGLEEVEQDRHGLIYASIPASPGVTGPVIAFNSHLDTSPETTGRDVKPQVIAQYTGGDIPLPGDPRQVIQVAKNPELEALRGCTLITTDGTTLLGGDDKAGVAIIMELSATLLEHPEIRHGAIRILFTCDEEIGRGVRHVDLEKLGAVVGYTLDGGGANEVDVETFSADRATVILRGVNIHPAIAKDRMINAIRAAGEFLAQLPADRLSPETTSEREGFLHPYQIQGSVAEATIQIILRDFETSRLKDLADHLEAAARHVCDQFPGLQCEVDVQTQYRNLAEGLRKEPRAVQYAQEAHRRLGRDARLTIIRGGTDGSMLTQQGLPTPNLSSGQHNLHSPLEWACLDEMLQALEVLVELAQIWSEDEAGS